MSFHDNLQLYMSVIRVNGVSNHGNKWVVLKVYMYSFIP